MFADIVADIPSNADLVEKLSDMKAAVRSASHKAAVLLRAECTSMPRYRLRVLRQLGTAWFANDLPQVAALSSEPMLSHFFDVQACFRNVADLYPHLADAATAVFDIEFAEVYSQEVDHDDALQRKRAAAIARLCPWRFRAKRASTIAVIEPGGHVPANDLDTGRLLHEHWQPIFLPARLTLR